MRKPNEKTRKKVKDALKKLEDGDKRKRNTTKVNSGTKGVG